MMKVIYPGSFDPITYGHIDIIKRCSLKFDKTIIAVLNNQNKKSLFNVEERIEMINQVTKEIDNIEVVSFTGLLTEFARKIDCSTIIRGLRAVSDYEYELQMALINKKAYPDIETLFMVASSDVSFLSSSIVKEIASYGGDIKCFVPKVVEDALNNKYGRRV
ncbi:MAG: pantetheine-phosphate adenylyltransferase [Tissierellales bacterium]|nr:pantetheine-phosphate adenylyltransferase [Tissierellales bacterium]